MALPFSDLQSVAPSAVIELFQLELNVPQHGVDEIYYFHAGVSIDASADIIWNGKTYLAFPIEATDFEYTGTGSLPRPKLQISNIFGTITAIMASLPSGLEGAKVTRIRTLARYLDGANFPVSGSILLTEDNDALLLEDGGSILLEPINSTEDLTAEFPREIYYIDRKAAENRDLIEFELASAFDLVGARAPKRQCVSNVCQWEYRKAGCGYAGNAYFSANDQPVAAVGQDICGKRLSSCEARFAQQRISGYVNLGGNYIAMSQGVSFSSGDPVSGFGLPAGTTVTSVSGNVVFVSQNATASSFATSTGTITGDGSQIVLSNAAGIAPGMFVSGAYLPANCQVVAVAGNTVTLSSLVSLDQFLSAVWTRTGNVPQSRDRNKVFFIDTITPMVVGQYIGSSLLPLSRKAVITDILNEWSGSTKITLTRYKVAVISQAVASDDSVSWTAYTPGAIPSATYSFAVSDANYTFRANAAIPYGSYPGIGSFVT
jgi:phage-related protein